MTTLYKRATRNQMKILRAVEGAVINEADGHGRPRNKIMARSIAKRATGTISSLWPDVLVASQSTPSNGIAVGLLPAVQHSGRSTSHCPQCSRRAHALKHFAKRGVIPGAVAPLKLLIKQISIPLGELKRSDPYRAKVHIDVLRKIDKIMKGL